MIMHNKKTLNDQRRGMMLLTQELRRILLPLYAQDGLYGKAIAYIKFFTPDSNWTWCATYAELGITGVMWSHGLCRVASQCLLTVVFPFDFNSGYSA